jgi:hypothetical protein
MAVVLVSVIAIAAFIVVFWLVQVVPVAVRAIAVARKSIDSMRDPALSDDIREKAVQEGALLLFRSFASIAIRSVTALVAALLPISVADWMGVAPIAHVLSFLARWDVIIGGTAVVVGIYYICARIWRRR